MSTYNKNGHIHGTFDRARHTKFEHIGRNASVVFWEQKGWNVIQNDIDDEGDVIKNCTDLIIEKNGKKILMEAATKRGDLFRYIKDGVDVETRKLKYKREGVQAFVAMCDYMMVDGVAVEGNEMLIIPMECLEVAQRDCGENYRGQGRVPSSVEFVMPEHGCHRVRKRCVNGFNQVGRAEDFYRIPYDYIAHYRKNEDGNYNLISKPNWRIKNG